MTSLQLDTAQRIADRYAHLECVQAVALSGSIQNGYATSMSDIDVYVYVTRDLTADERTQLAEVDARDRIVNDTWGAGDVWVDVHSNVEVDLMYFTTQWIEAQIHRTLVQCQAWTGYTTAFWHTVKISRILFDRDNWFAQLQQRANQPYPEQLRQNIITHNYPLLRTIPHAYSKQIAKAIKRDDFISVNHRISALLESYFDIFFAVNRLPHPGEKRQLQIALSCEKQPESMESDLRALVRAVGDVESVPVALDTLLVHLAAWLSDEGLLPFST